MIMEKKEAYKRWLNTKTIEDKMNYKRLTAIVKRESRKRKRLSWEKFVSNIEHDLYRIRPNSYKILKHLNQDTRETGSLKCKLDSDKFFYYYKNLWNDYNFNQQNWTPENYENYEITEDELETILTKLRNGKAPGEDNIPSELYKYSSKKFKTRLLKFFNQIYIQETIPEEWQKATVVPIFKKGDQKDPKNYRGISLLNSCYKIYAQILNEKLKLYTENFIDEEQCGFRKGRSCIDAAFTLKLLIERRREFNLETHLLFLDYEKAFDEVRRPLLFNILKNKHVPNPLFAAITRIYENNDIKVKLDSKLTKPISINKGVRQGCPLSPTLFNIYINEIISEWKLEDIKGIKILRNKNIQTILYADDQVVIADSEDTLQKSVYKLQLITEKYGLKISSNKTKTMAFKGRDPIRSKIVINNNTIEQINTFNYLGCSISYQDEKDITSKTMKFLKITGIINKVLKPSQVQKQTRLKIYNTLAIPTLLYGCETWAIKKKDESRITAAEMKFMRRTANYTWQDYKTNTEILSELEVEPVLDKIHHYRNKWRLHVERMPRERLPKLILKYHPTGKRSQGRPVRRILDRQ